MLSDFFIFCIYCEINVFVFSIHIRLWYIPQETAFLFVCVGCISCISAVITLKYTL